MKKFLSVFFILSLALNAQAGIYVGNTTAEPSKEYMTVSQYAEYENAVGYLECRSANGSNCDGFDSVDAAEKYINGVKYHEAPINYGQQKQDLDDRANEVMERRDDSMSLSQYDDYKKAVEYLECRGLNGTGCGGFDSVEAAEKYIDGVKYQDAPANYGEQKQDLDDRANEAMERRDDSMSLSQYDDYKKAVEYLECKESKGSNCTGFDSEEAAKKYIDGVKYQDAPANYGYQKQELDDRANEVMEERDPLYMTVSEFAAYEDAVNYLECKHQNGNYCDGFDSEAEAKEYVDSLEDYEAPISSESEKQILDEKMEKISQDMDEFGNFTSYAGGDKQIATSDQLDEYERAVQYLVCIYSDAPQCSGYSSPEAARKYIKDIKDNYDAVGLNAPKKRNLDGLAEDVLPLISADEAREFANYLAKLSPAQYLDEMHESSTVTTTHEMPGENTLAAAERGNYNDPNINNDMERSTSVLTKEEFAEQVTVDASVIQPYTSAPLYLKDVETTKQVENTTSYDIMDGQTQALVFSHQVQEAPGMSMKKELDSSVYLRRYEEHGYALKVEKQEVLAVSKIDPEVFDEEKLPVIEIELKSSITDYNEIDEGWQNRYADVEAANAEERKIDGNYMMLEYAVDIAGRLREQAQVMEKDLSDPHLSERERQVKLEEMDKLESDASKALIDARQYYNNLSEFTHIEKVRVLRSKYLSM